MQKNVLFLVAPFLNKIMTSIIFIVMKKRGSTSDRETSQLGKTIMTFLFALNNFALNFVLFFFFLNNNYSRSNNKRSIR